ncbi:MAG TPA: branched-chain amino acid ABC transporter permease [Casimicrobiaceae bacterium]|jgi:branched-chain amino acid transport system permease protein
MKRGLLPWLLVAAALLMLFPLVAEKFYLQLVTKIMILSIFTLSLDLLVGYTGLVSLGHAAYFGIAAYTFALVSQAADPANLWLTLPLALAASAALALAVGALVVRTSGVYFIMVTLAFAQMVYYFFHDTRVAGGSDGIYVNTRPDAVLPGLDLANDLHFYYFVLAMLAVVFALLAVILRSPFGRALQGIKVNEHRMRALGFATLRYKLAAFVLAGTIAGLAGYLAAAKEGYVNPEMMAWHQSGAVLMMLILGGMGTLVGAVLGAFSYVLLQEWFSALTRHWQLLMGGFIVVAVLLLPQGLVGAPRMLRWAGLWRSKRDDD